MSMAHSLELRAPFLDYRIAEFAYRLPANWKIDANITKLMLKNIFGPRLPKEVTAQRKWGFALPMEHWLRKELRPALEEALADPVIGSAGIFSNPELRSLAEEHWNGTRDRTEILWRYLFFRRWWYKKMR